MKFKMAMLAAVAALMVAAYNVAQFSPEDGGEFRVGNVGGKLVAVEAFAPTNGTVELKRVWASDVYTNAVAYLVETSTVYTVTYSNAYTHVVSTNAYRDLSWIYNPGIIAQTTNDTVSVTTNMWPVFKERVSVTNSLVSGVAADNVFTNALTAPVYLAPGEKLYFSGTATGGFLRLITE